MCRALPGAESTIFGSTTVTNSVITGNTAGNGADGAGLYNDGSLSVSDSTVSGNTGGAGAGIYNFSGQLTVSDSTISDNTTSLNGGGVSNDSPGATATITDSTFSGDSAAVGGALYVTREHGHARGQHDRRQQRECGRRGWHRQLRDPRHGRGHHGRQRAGPRLWVDRLGGDRPRVQHRRQRILWVLRDREYQQLVLAGRLPRSSRKQWRTDPDDPPHGGQSGSRGDPLSDHGRCDTAVPDHRPARDRRRAPNTACNMGAVQGVVGPPTISGFTPPSGSSGTVVTITGTNLLGATEVTFNGKAGTVNTVGQTEITVTVPPGATTGYITVTTPSGNVTSATQFTYIGPTITGFTPSSGPPGTVVTITGTNLAVATEVSFNGKAATDITSDTPTKITVKVPAGATTGYITVTAPNGSVTSATKFIYVGPTITGFSPSSGPPGTVVTITGTNLSNTTAVAFNGKAGTVTSDGSTKITVKVPTGATTGYIRIVTPVEAVNSTTEFTDAAPTITGFTPSFGLTGTVVTITGTNLSGATWGHLQRPHITGTVTSDMSTMITVTVPTGATTGDIQCHNFLWNYDQRQQIRQIIGPTHDHRVHPVVGPTRHGGDHHRDQPLRCN